MLSPECKAQKGKALVMSPLGPLVTLPGHNTQLDPYSHMTVHRGGQVETTKNSYWGKATMDR